MGHVSWGHSGICHMPFRAKRVHLLQAVSQGSIGDHRLCHSSEGDHVDAMRIMGKKLRIQLVSLFAVVCQKHYTPISLDAYFLTHLHTVCEALCSGGS